MSIRRKLLDNLATKNQNFQLTRDSTLDTSRLPSYEDFAKDKKRFLNSTRYSEHFTIMVTDDESDESDKSVNTQTPTVALRQTQTQTPSYNNKENQTPTKSAIKIHSKVQSDDEYVHVVNKACQTSFEHIEIEKPAFKETQHQKYSQIFLTQKTQKETLFQNKKVLTTEERFKVNEESILVINHQLKPPMNKIKKRVSMCIEDLPVEIVENNLDADENRLDCTNGRIFTLNPLSENSDESSDSSSENEVNEEPVKTQIPRKIIKVSSDSESNDEAFEKFLNQHRPRPRQSPRKFNSKQTRDFVVSDSDCESSVSSSKSDRPKNNQLFYIQTTRKITQVQKKKTETESNDEKLAFITARTSVLEISSSDESPKKLPSRKIETPKSIISIGKKTPSRNKKHQRSSSSELEENKPKIIQKARNESNPIFGVFQTSTKETIRVREFMSERKPTSQKRQFGFIESLSTRIPEDLRHSEAAQYIKNFTKKKVKEELLQKLFLIFNKSIFDNKLPSDLKLQWNNRLTATAGLCKYKSVGGRPTAEIHISTKVCDIPERLRDTCVHEMCHAACYLIDGLKNEGHGRVWQTWARKVGDVYVDIPKVSTCHNYAINKKYTYKCKDCGEEIHRFQKSINIDKMVCGRCHGRFDLYCNNVKLNAEIIDDQQAQFQTPQNKKVNKFAQFVKENYGSVKSEKKLAHKDVMQELSKQFKQLNY